MAWSLYWFCCAGCVVQVNDHSALSQAVKEEMYKCYPEARRAQLKTGGNFPYLSRPDEVNMFLQVLTCFYLSHSEIVYFPRNHV